MTDTIQKPSPTPFCMAATPFSPDGEVDEAALRGQVRRFVDAGLGVYFGSGGAGEGHTLSNRDLDRLYRVAGEEAAGRIPVCANPPEQASATAVIEQAALAQSAGVQAVSIYPAAHWHGFRANENELGVYYRFILERIATPVMLTFNPNIGAVPSTQFLAGLIDRWPQIKGINLIGPSEEYFVELRQILSPKMPIYLPAVRAIRALELGAAGFIGAEANVIPASYRRLADLHARGATTEATDLQTRIQEFAAIVADWSTATARWIKMAWRAYGLPGGEGGLRPPYLMPPQAEIDRLAARLAAVGLEEITALQSAVRASRG